jgi:tryptophanyl-tRNA synthetase
VVRLRMRLPSDCGHREYGARAEGSPNTFLAVRIFSGIQPTGRKHLGNYIGAISQYVESQDRGDGIFCLVDLHAVSVAYEPAELRERLYDTTAILLAAGIDPERCILFRQSDVHEHTELCWLLSAVTAHGDLNRMTQFKDKAEKQRELVSAALFFYPVLQAADVLAYRAHEVPVGDDQRQHIELMREIARRFNERFGETLVEPDHRIPEVGARIMDLQDPGSKMSTTSASDLGTVYVLDEPSRITKKVKSAVTDSGTGVHRGEGKEGVANLIDILAAVRGSTPDIVEAEFEGSGYGDFKGAVAEAVVEYLAPVHERYAELRPDEGELERMLAAGAGKAREIAAGTLADVREAMGVGAPTGTS